jgi:hypothetical protein
MAIFPDPGRGRHSASRHRVFRVLPHFGWAKREDAVKLGYKDADPLRQSADFRLLRKRDDFQALLKQIDRKK